MTLSMKIKRTLSAGVVGFWAALATLGVAQAAGEVAFVNFERVYQESKVVQEVRDVINADFLDRETKLRDQDDEIRGIAESLEKDALTLSDADREKRRAEIEQKERNFVRDRRALVEDRGVIMQERRRLIDIAIAKIIEEVAEEREYSMVINPYLTLPLSGNRTLTHNIILFADGDADITADVISQFDSEMKAANFQ